MKRIKLTFLNWYALGMVFLSGFVIDFMDIYVEIIGLVAVGISFKLAIGIVFSKKYKYNEKHLIVIPIATILLCMFLLAYIDTVQSVVFMYISLFMLYAVRIYVEQKLSPMLKLA